MVTRMTIARPYAKAVFLTAKASGAYSKWFSVLECLHYIIEEKSVRDFFLNPVITNDLKHNFISNVLKNFFDSEWFGFVFLLLKNKRLVYSSEIFTLYKLYCEEEQGIVRADIFSPMKLLEQEHTVLISYLSKKLKKK